MKYIYYAINRFIYKRFENHMSLNNGHKLHVTAIEFVNMRYEYFDSYDMNAKYTLCDDNGNTQQFPIHGLDQDVAKRLLKNTLLKNKDTGKAIYNIRIGRSKKNQVRFLVSRIELEGTRAYRERNCYKGSMSI